jgi:hypothetical protein
MYMQHSNDCRERALVCLAISSESTQFKDQTLAIAQMWLTLAAIEDMIKLWKNQVERRALN